MDKYSLTAAIIRATMPTPYPSNDMTQEQKDLYNSLTVKSAYQRCWTLRSKSADERVKLCYEWVRNMVIDLAEYRQIIEYMNKNP